MANEIFNFETEFKLGIDEVDCEHMKLVDMLNAVHALIREGKKDEARQYFSETLSAYVVEHFANEEAFMERMGYPNLEDHKKIHENFKKSFSELLPKIESFDDRAFRMALTDAFTWIISHIGKTDKKYAKYYEAQG
jgi:hemerythrin